MQTTKNAKIRRFIVRKACSEEKAKGGAGQSFASSSECQKITVFSYTVPVCMLSCFNHVQLFATLRTIAHQAPLSMGFSMQEYWSWLLCHPSGGLGGSLKRWGMWLSTGACQEHLPSICLWEDWILCCWSCSPSTHPEVYFQELSLWTQILHLLISRKTLHPSMVTLVPCD